MGPSLPGDAIDPVWRATAMIEYNRRMLAVLMLAVAPLAAAAQDACPDRSSYAPARGIIADLGRLVAPSGVHGTGKSSGAPAAISLAYWV